MIALTGVTDIAIVTMKYTSGMYIVTMKDILKYLAFKNNLIFNISKSNSLNLAEKLLFSLQSKGTLDKCLDLVLF